MYKLFMYIYIYISIYTHIYVHISTCYGKGYLLAFQ